MTKEPLMAYDLEEQDQLEDLKAWWKQWGNTIAGIVIAVSVGVIAVQGWRWWTQQQAAQAAVIYDAVNAAVRANDAAKANDAMSQLVDKFPGTGYAPRAALLVAAQLFENGDAAGAKALLTWVIEKSSEDELKQIARLRLAEILLDGKQYDEALRVLDAKHDQPFAGIYADTRGDVLAAAGRTEEARNEYQTALAQLDPQSAYRNFVQLKLDAMPQGAGAAAKAATTPAAAQPAAAAAATPPPVPAQPAAATPAPQPAAAAPASGAKSSGTPSK
jgi:predicted negative regulator of RcsB-dependent stress response